MLNKKLAHIAVILLALGFVACSSDDDTYDKAKAVLAFADSDHLKIDEKLGAQEIKLAPQTDVKEFGSSQINQRVENIKFSSQGKKFLKDDSQFWAGYQTSYKDRFVFAPIIRDNKIYVLDPKGILSSYDLTSGKRIYKNRIFKKRYLKLYQNPRIGFFADKIFAIAGANEISAARLDNGEVLWRKTILSIPVSRPISDGKLVYFTTNDSKTYALDAASGELVWVASGVAKPTAIFGSADPVLSNEKLIVSYASGEIYALDKNSGEPLWTQNLNISKAIDSDFYLNDIDATPIAKNGIVYAIGNGGLLMAIDEKEGDYLWKKEIAGIADFWASSGFLFVIDNQDRLICLAQKNGAVKYISQLAAYRDKKKPQSKIIYNGVVMAGDKLLISDMRGRLLVANPQDGKVEQEIKLRQKISHAPIVVGGRIYLHGSGRFTTNVIEVE